MAWAISEQDFPGEGLRTRLRFPRQPGLRLSAGARQEAPARFGWGMPTLVPAPASVPGLDESREGITVYRCAAGGRLGGWIIRSGARVLLARRLPEAGDLVAVATRRSVRLTLVRDPSATVEEGRIIGVVEGIIGEAR